MGTNLNNNALLIGADDGGKESSGTMEAATAIWYNQKYIDAMGMTEAGATTFHAPDANTVGGWQSDAATEILYFSFKVKDDWDAASDILIKVIFEVNVDNSSGAVDDTCGFVWYAKFKGDGETSTKGQNAAKSVTVGQCSQYTQFTATINVDYDHATYPIEVGDSFGCYIYTAQFSQDVTNLIINGVEILYQSKQPNALEV